MSGNAPTPTPPAPSNGPEGDAGGSTQQQQPPAPPAQPHDQSQPAPTDQTQQASSEPSEQPGQQGLETASRDDLLAEIRTLRRENAKRRTTTQEATQTAAEQAKSELAQQIGKALGLVEDGEATPDASKLTEQLTQQTQAAKQAQLELAVYKAAGTHGADADALLDSRSFLEKVADLDPTNTDDLNTAIKEVVESNPRLQQGQVPPKRSSAPLNNRNSESVAQTPEELAKLIPRGF